MLPPCTIYLDERNCGSLKVNYEQEVIKLDYDVSGESKELCFSVCAIELKETDQSEYNTLVFRIKGATGGDITEVGLKDMQGNEPKIKVHDYLSGGITKEWQEVTIPLAAFTSISNWTGVQAFSIAFSNGIGSAKGTIFLGKIDFDAGMVPLVVDTFDDQDNENALRGGYGTFAAEEGGAVVRGEFDTDSPFSGMGASYCLEYRGVTPLHYAAWETDLRGLDASQYQVLSLWIRGISGNEPPHLYLSDVKGRKSEVVEVEKKTSVTTSWQELRIPLAEFRGVDLHQLSKLQIAFEWRDMSGTICVDDIRFVEDSGQE